MNEQTRKGFRPVCRSAQIATGLLLLLAPSGVMASNDAAARFGSAPHSDLEVTNVRWEAETKDYSCVTLDVAWGHSWRAKWTEPAEKTVTGKPVELENWDAAWVFVKFLPEKDSRESIERNHWRHATLDTDVSHHVMTAGATCTVGLSDDGHRGIGVFIYRDALGNGPVAFKGVRLRWCHAADGIDPAKAAVQAHALAMVYVPAGAFAAGWPVRVGIDRFPDGPRRPIVGGTLPRGGSGGAGAQGNPDYPPGSFGALTDGAWRGGEPAIPLLIDAEWSGPVASGSPARRVGPKRGWLWGDLVFDYHNRGLSHGWGAMGPVAEGYPHATLHNEYPTGYEAFYCMKYHVTQGQYAAFLNSLPPDVAAKRAFVSGDGEKPTTWNTNRDVQTEKREVSVGAGYKPALVEEWDGHTIRASNEVLPRIPIAEAAGGGGLTPDAHRVGDELLDRLLDDAMKEKGPDAKSVPVYRARVPERPCNWVNWADGLAYSVWAGLRPMTELESEKLSRGPSRPGPDEGLRQEEAFRKRPASIGLLVADPNYWGVRMDGTVSVTVGTTAGRSFRGTHGDGATPAGDPGAALKRGGTFGCDTEGFNTVPCDWPGGTDLMGGGKGGSNRGYIGVTGARYQTMFWRAVRSASRTPAPAPAAEPEPPESVVFPGDDDGDPIAVSHVRWEPGTEDYSFVTFDLAWEDSWRAAWTEPAEKNLTGKPLAIESWDAAWVFVKFRTPGAAAEMPAALASEADDHVKPAGAALDVGLSDDGQRGVGVFVYRYAAGHGPVAFKGLKLRWLHPSAPQPPQEGRGSAATGGPEFDPAKAEVTVRAIGMVYVGEGPFTTYSPLHQPIILGGPRKRAWAPRYPVSPITTPDPTQPGGYFASAGVSEPETAVPETAGAWPNGYRAFYCMKRSITQGEFAALLNSAKGLDYNGRYYGALPMEACRPNNEKLHYGRFYGLCGWTIKQTAGGKYETDTPQRVCSFMSWPDIMSFSAWAGLRPPTLLEYEKACRGPRVFATEEDAWTDTACAPAAGLPAASSLATAGASYWGIRQLSLSGCSHEWPGTAGAFEFKGTHGNGTPEAPPDWPYATAFGEWFYMSWQCSGGSEGFTNLGIWVVPNEMGRVRKQWMDIDSDRTGRYGFHAVRTAPFKAEPNSPLQMDRLPNLAAYDVGIVHLAGRLRNDRAEPLEIEVATPLPGECFPEGRAFTAAANSVTPFSVLAVVTPDTVASALRGGRFLPVEVRTPGGGATARQQVRLTMDDPGKRTPAVIGSLDGGEVTLRILNSTNRAQTVTIELTPPPGAKFSETDGRIKVAPGAETLASFPVPRQSFGTTGICRMPYRISVAAGAPQSGETLVDLRAQSRWWISRRIKQGPKLDTAGAGAGRELEDFGIADVLPDARPSGVPEDLFTNPKPPEGWQETVCGEVLPLDDLGAMPSPGSSALAATRVQSPDDRRVVMNVNHELKPLGQDKPEPRFSLRIWLNGEIVYHARPVERTKGKTGDASQERGAPVRIRRGVNTLLVECRSEEDVPANPGSISVHFSDAGDGKRLTELVFDIAGR